MVSSRFRAKHQSTLRHSIHFKEMIGITKYDKVKIVSPKCLNLHIFTLLIRITHTVENQFFPLSAVLDFVVG